MRYLAILLIGLSFSLFAYAQLDDGNTNLGEKTKNTTLKKGFSVGGTPVLALDPDLGLKYGA